MGYWQMLRDTKLMIFDETTLVDHRVFLFDDSIKDHFDVLHRKHEKNVTTLLNPTKRLNRDTFKEKSEESISGKNWKSMSIKLTMRALMKSK